MVVMLQEIAGCGNTVEHLFVQEIATPEAADEGDGVQECRFAELRITRNVLRPRKGAT